MTDNSTPKGFPRAGGPKAHVGRSIFDDTAEFAVPAGEDDETGGAGGPSGSDGTPSGEGSPQRPDTGAKSAGASSPNESGGGRERVPDESRSNSPAQAGPVGGPKTPRDPSPTQSEWDAAMREASAREATAREAAAREATAREAAAREATAREAAAQEATARDTRKQARDTGRATTETDVSGAGPREHHDPDLDETMAHAVPPSRLTDPAPPRHRPVDEPVPFWRRRPVVIAGGVLGGLLVLYGAAYAVAGGSLARSATVLGVEVGGLTPAEAEAKLAAELPALVDQPIDLTVEHAESTYSLVPSEAGLSVDYTATVDTIPGGSANPFSLVSALFGGGEVQPIPSVDRSALEASLTATAEETDVEPVNGGVAFRDGEVVTSEAESGRSIDVAATADQLELSFFGGEGQHELPVGAMAAVAVDVEPAVTDAEVEQAVAEFAEPAMSGPVRIAADEHTIAIEPEMISEALTLTPDDSGTLRPAIDGDALAEAASDVLDDVGQPGREATIRIQSGAPTIIPHEIGVGISSGELADAILPVLTETGDARSATVEYSEAEPEFTTEDAEALGVTEVVSEFTTRFPHAQYRNVNIGLAASRVNNTLLKPGDEFSLNGIVGERTAANGFAKGGTISGGVLVEDYGGGVSQVATTTYHAAFKAGLEDIYHQPHSIYFDRYPVAQEATVSWGNFDMAFRNDTPYGVLVEARFSASTPGSQGVLTVRIWSTEYFKVETSVSERSNFTDPQTIYNDKDNCLPNRQGSRGFSITSFRKVSEPDGTLVKDESYPWTYRPNPVVICGDEPKDEDKDDD